MTTDPTADAAKLLPPRMKMTDVKVGDRLVSTIAGGPAFSPITVTEITERGFRYKLDAPVCLHPLMGTTEGGEHFGHDGECFYEPDTRPQPAPPEGEPDFSALWDEYSIALQHPGGEHCYVNQAVTFGALMYRLAARPKVEDATPKDGRG